MDERDLLQYKEKLEQRRRQLIEQVQRSENVGREAESEEEIKDMVDKAVSSYIKERMFSQSNADRRMLLMVAEALDRIERGEFGICPSCEEEIGSKRLHAIPWARLCLRCQEEVEKGEG